MKRYKPDRDIVDGVYEMVETIDGDYVKYSDYAALLERCEKAEAEVKRLDARDCNATVELCYANGDDPYAREDLVIVDVGVSDNCYVVNSKVLTEALTERDKLKAGDPVRCQKCNEQYTLGEKESKVREALQQEHEEGKRVAELAVLHLQRMKAEACEVPILVDRKKYCVELKLHNVE